VPELWQPQAGAVNAGGRQGASINLAETRDLKVARVGWLRVPRLPPRALGLNSCRAEGIVGDLSETGGNAMKRMVGIVLFAALSAGPQALADDGDITVMTYNQYLGADFTALAAAGDASQFNTILVGILERIAASNFQERAQRQADQIARHLPDLVGLQEVWTLACTPKPGPACDQPAIAGAFTDHETVTLDALSDLGADYETVARVRNLNLDIPFAIGGSFAILEVTDHDVILKRTETVSHAEAVTVDCARSLDGCNYEFSLLFSSPLGPVDFLRGFVAVDATVRGKDYLFVNTHLEIKQPEPANPLSRIFQSIQAAELIEWLDVLQQERPFTPLIVVGDMNSSPEDEPVFDIIIPPYQRVVAAGYADIWTLRPGPSLRSVVKGLELRSDFRALAGVARRRVPTAGGGRGWG
jgi:hypothetical protein